MIRPPRKERGLSVDMKRGNAYKLITGAECMLLKPHLKSDAPRTLANVGTSSSSPGAAPGERAGVVVFLVRSSADPTKCRYWSCCFPRVVATTCWTRSGQSAVKLFFIRPYAACGRMQATRSHHVYGLCLRRRPSSLEGSSDANARSHLHTVKQARY